LEEFGTESLPIPVNQPWWNGCVERIQQSLKSELLEWLAITNEGNARELCSQYQIYYSNHRPHQSINGATPKSLAGHKMEMAALVQKNMEKASICMIGIGTNSDSK
jgi:transposase InsO family protein